MITEQSSTFDLTCIAAATPRERSDNQRVRYEVFRQTTPYGARRTLVPRESDEFDALPDTTTLLNLYSGGEPVGAARLLVPNEEVARHNGWQLGLPIEERLSLGDLVADGPLAEGGRFCVVPAFWGTPASFVLMQGLFHECRLRGVRLIVACANAETDSEEDARLQVRALAARRLVSERHRMPPVTPQRVGHPPVSPRRPFYTREERRAIAEGTGPMRVARPLMLYAKLGARFTGEPIFDECFGLYAVPLVLPVPQCASTDDAATAPTLHEVA